MEKKKDAELEEEIPLLCGECDSDEEEREAGGQPYLTDDDESSSDNSYLDPEDCAMAMDHFNNLHAQPGYQCTGTPIDQDL